MHIYCVSHFIFSIFLCRSSELCSDALPAYEAALKLAPGDSLIARNMAAACEKMHQQQRGVPASIRFSFSMPLCAHSQLLCSVD